MKFFKSSSWRVKTPLLIQMQIVECGAASLGIILGYYGKFVSIGELRHKCGVTRDGCNGLDILKAGEFYGLKGEAFQVNLEALEDVKKPAILFWDAAHFVVLEGFSRKKAFINDPAHGPITISKEEFLSRFSGIAFFFEPRADFAPSKVPQDGFSSLAKSWKLKKSFFLFLALSGFILLLPFLTLPTMLRLFLDYVYSSDILAWKEECLIFFFSALLFGSAFALFYFSSIHKTYRVISLDSSSRFFWRMLRLPISFYEEREPREIALRLKANQEMQQTFIEEFIPAQMLLFFSFFYACVLFSYDIGTAVATFGASLSCLGLMHIINRKRLSLLASFEKDWKSSESYGLEILHSIEPIKSTGTENHFLSKWLSYYTRFINAQQEIGKKGIFLSVFPLFTQLFCTALLLGLGGSHVLSGKLSLGMLAAFQIFFILFIIPFRNFIDLSEKIARGRKELFRTNDIMYTEIDPFFSSRGSQTKDEPLSGLVEFKDVAFSYYPASPPILQGLSFRLNPGNWTGITGETGSGKSTVGKLAGALFYPQSGRILYDGKEVNEIASTLFRNSVAWIGQESYLFEGSFRDNIALGRTVTEAELFESAKLAHIHDWIMKKPNQYDDLIYEGGKNLCHSQKQQIEIARVFLSTPSLLIIDEGLNSLDRELLKKILSSLRLKKITCLFITLQDEILQECDEIFFLEEGKRMDI